MSATAIDYIELDSENLGASRTFFTAAFGWRFTDYGPDYAGIEDAKLDGGISQKRRCARQEARLFASSSISQAAGGFISASRAGTSLRSGVSGGLGPSAFPG